MDSFRFCEGVPATNEQFVGRALELQGLFENVKTRNNVSLVGLPQIGKSSLVAEFMVRFEEQLRSLNIYCARFVFQRKQTPEDVFMFLIDIIRKISDEKAEIQIAKRCNELAESGLTRNFEQHITEMADEFFTKHEVRIRLFCDEFDYAPSVLGDYIDCLRTIIGDSNSIRIVTISRATIADLFYYTPNGSNFPARFPTIAWVKGFCDYDKKEYLSILKRYLPENIDWERVERLLSKYAANHPYYLSVLANAFLNSHYAYYDDGFLGEDDLINTALENALITIDESFEKLCVALARMGLAPSIRKLSYGLMSDISRKDLNKLTRLGLVDEHSTCAINYLAEYVMNRATIPENIDELKGYLKQAISVSELLSSMNFEKQLLQNDTLKHSIEHIVKFLALTIEALEKKSEFRPIITQTDISEIERLIGEGRKWANRFKH